MMRLKDTDIIDNHQLNKVVLTLGGRSVVFPSNVRFKKKEEENHRFWKVISVKDSVLILTFLAVSCILAHY